MKKLIKLTDGKIKRLEKKFIKIIEKEYDHVDGKKFAQIRGVEISRSGEEVSTIFFVDYGVAQTEGEAFQETAYLTIADGREAFLIGQFYQAVKDKPIECD